MLCLKKMFKETWMVIRRSIIRLNKMLMQVVMMLKRQPTVMMTDVICSLCDFSLCFCFIYGLSPRNLCIMCAVLVCNMICYI